jgi:hypothetical protein
MMTFALSHVGIPSEWWRAAFAVVGAIIVGGAAWVRLSTQADPA